MTDLFRYRRKVQQLEQDYRHAQRTSKDEEVRLWEAQAHLLDCEEAQKILQTVAQAVQESAHTQIAGVVTRCLKAVFGEEAYEFAIRFERKRGKTEAHLVFLLDGQEVDPKGAAGGGSVDVAAFALRVACLLLQQPPLRRLVIADEPFKWVNGEEFQQRVGDLVLTLAEELNVQFLVVTDDEWLKVGKAVEL